MNRRQRRAEAKELMHKTGVSRNTAEAYITLREMGINNPFTAREFQEDDKVMLDIERIKSRENYEKMSDMYKEFVETHADDIFTVHVEANSLIALKESPEWLFWPGDLKGAENRDDDGVNDRVLAYFISPETEDEEADDSSATTTASV